MANQLPKSGLIKSLVTDADRYLGYTARGFVNTTERGVFSIRAKVEFEAAKTNQRFVHIMFTHTNKFWARTEDVRHNWVVALSNQPEEDASKPSCTMWEPLRVGGIWRFRHVHSGRDLCVVRGTSNAFVNPGDVAADDVSFQFSVVDRDTLVLLPELVAFKGPNGKYLKGIVINNRNYLQFSSDDPTEAAAAHEISAMVTGYSSIRSSFFNQIWRRDPTDGMILGGRVTGTSSFDDTQFWPVKVNKSSIALRNLGNNRFCKRYTLNNNLQHLLNADDTTISALSVISVEELVLEREIINVRYRVADARIYNETVSVVGRGSAVNNSDETNTLVVRISYEDSSSFTFTNSLSIATSVQTMFKAGIPLIGQTEITVGVEVTTSSEWGETTTQTRSSQAEYTAVVPPRSRVTIDFVSTNGTCSVPFDYTQRDRLAKDGSFVETPHTDGIFHGANYYSFHFENEVIQRILLPNEENPAAGLESLQI